MKNYIEKGPERIPTREEVLDVIARVAENASISRELSDDYGLYLLEARVEREKQGDTIQYEYMRKGRFPNHNEAVETAIYSVEYENGLPVGGEKVAIYKPETSEWEILQND